VTSPLSHLEPIGLWKHFDSLRAIPRPSGDESKVIEYIEANAKRMGWGVRRDAVGNICLQVPSSQGREGQPIVVLQAHLDMVCEKEVGSDFDFSRAPIDVSVHGDWVSSKGTTLGADNGIGVAAALAVCEDTNSHFSPARSTPPLKTFVGVFISAFLQIALMDSLYCALVIFL